MRVKPKEDSLWKALKVGLAILRTSIFSARSNSAFPAVFRGVGGKRMLLFAGMLISAYFLGLLWLGYDKLEEADKWLRMTMAVSWRAKPISFALAHSFLPQLIKWTFLWPLVAALLIRRFFSRFEDELRVLPYDPRNITEAILRLLILTSLLLLCCDFILTAMHSHPWWEKILRSATAKSHHFESPHSLSKMLFVLTVEIFQQISWVLAVILDIVITFCLLILVRSLPLGLAAVFVWKFLATFISLLCSPYDTQTLLMPYAELETSSLIMLEEILSPLFVFLSLYFSIILIYFLHRRIEKNWREHI